MKGEPLYRPSCRGQASALVPGCLYVALGRVPSNLQGHTRHRSGWWGPPPAISPRRNRWEGQGLPDLGGDLADQRRSFPGKMGESQPLGEAQKRLLLGGSPRTRRWCLHARGMFLIGSCECMAGRRGRRPSLLQEVTRSGASARRLNCAPTDEGGKRWGE